MRRVLLLLVAVVACAGTFSLATVHVAQEDQEALARQLLGEDVAARREALVAVGSIRPESIGPELRQALISSLERSADESRQRREASQAGEPVEYSEDPEAYLAFVRLVVALDTPEAIPALIGALETGLRSAHALARFGERAVPALLAVIMTPEDWSPAHVRNAVSTFQYMVQATDAGTVLSPGSLDQVSGAIEDVLRETDEPTVLMRAIDFGITLGHSRLREIVTAIAADARSIRERGIEEGSVERIQQRAAEALEGNLRPLPDF